MDPITAFQVAGTVITFVEFGRSLLTEAREVYKSPSGTTSKVIQLDSIANDLAAAGDQVSASLAKSTPSSQATSDQTLLRLCGQCTSIKGELQKALGNLQARGDTKFNYAISSVATAFKAIWSQSKINDLDERLRRIQSEMTMAVLISLWEEEKVHGKTQEHLLNDQIEKVKATVNRTDEKIDNLMQDLLQTSANSVNASNKRSLLFRELWKMDWRPDRDLINEDKQTTDLIEGDIINSLWFQSIESRDKSISDTYKSTYEWIFDQDSETRFTNWLRGNDNPVYWITGKAGSGKSTLMKYVAHHPTTMSHLQHWAGDSPILFTHFYFWEATTETLQHSREGLMRTILWHCFRARPDLIAKATPRRWAAYNALRGWEGSAPDWTWDELQETFQNLASMNSSSFKLVMFLDGLDEFDGDPEVLVDWMKDVVKKFNIKICVGSRPWTSFSDAFNQYPSLAMQFLTKPDIEAYINGHFETSPAFREWQALSPEGAEGLRQQVSTKADGVFLWVYLVVRELMPALAKGKSLPELHAILKDLPVDIIKLYSKIYKGLDPDDVKTAARYFTLRLTSLSPFTSRTLWLIEEGTMAIPQNPLQSNSGSDPLRDILRRRLNSFTRGMMELSKNGSIEFHHRSVREWLLLEDVSPLIAASLPLDFNANLLLLKAHIDSLRGDGFRLMFVEQATNSSFFTFWSAIAIAFYYATGLSESPNMTPALILQLDKFKVLLDLQAKLLCKDEPNFAGLEERASNFNDRKSRFLRPITSAILGRQIIRQVESEFERKEQYKVGHWSLTQDDFRDSTEDCFTGVAAQYGILPYVMTKVKENRDLIKQKGDRRSLLHNAVFGKDIYLRGRVFLGHDERIGQMRLKLVEALLDAGASPKGPVHLPDVFRNKDPKAKDFDYVDAIYSLYQDILDQVGPEEYRSEVIRLLKKRKRWSLKF
ncbi:ent-kaurene oxidase [Fusarium austroafricanum]|uniref:Ent-kaurene oxidase n=1 Tax=Fusarium austroafricanum TaxID=2364996 RepID=A0A8H4K3V5_9HYPO|nr:ent-kaurene oxidase [Fusarium austroafricanum]